jgi:hypothetical protein
MISSAVPTTAARKGGICRKNVRGDAEREAVPRGRRAHKLSRGRFAAALMLLGLLPFATMVPALAALALVTAIWLALHGYEFVWWREARAESRSMLASS